jgi:hypothetical protein
MWRTDLMRKALLATVAGISVLLAAAPSNAHHSFAAEYDATKPITLKGTIVRFDFVNPHAWLYITVKEADGKETRWNIEMSSPNALIRRGVNKTSVPIGSEVTVVGYRARDNSSTMNGTSVKMSDGRNLFTGSEGTGAPATPRTP